MAAWYVVLSDKNENPIIQLTMRATKVEVNDNFIFIEQNDQCTAIRIEPEDTLVKIRTVK